MTARHYARTLLRVEGTVDGPDGLGVQVLLPAWNPHRHVLLPAEAFPEHFISHVEHSPGPAECHMSLLAVVDLAAERAADLDLSGPFELARSRRVDDPDAPSGMAMVDLGRDFWDADGLLCDGLGEDDWTAARTALQEAADAGGVG